MRKIFVLFLSFTLLIPGATSFAAKKKAKTKKTRAVPAVVQNGSDEAERIKKELVLDPGQDIEIIPTGDGFDMYIRKKPYVNSVMLTDSPKDPKYKNHSYGLRALKFNSVNGREKRILDEKTIEPKSSPLYFLVDSTPEPHKKFGRAFHIYLPDTVVYGYSWSRNGMVPIKTGSVINLRIFSKPYTDYRGPFIDQTYVMKIREPDRFPPGLVECFSALANITGGKYYIADDGLKKGMDDLMNGSLQVQGRSGGPADVVFVVDSTQSMWDDMPEFKAGFSDTLSKILARFPGSRLGMVLYRDYDDSYLTKVYDFTTNEEQMRYQVSGIQIMGGGDIPEAVCEALYDSVTRLEWKSGNRFIYLVGDAPPHPEPRGRITHEMTTNGLMKKRITVYPLIVPVKQ